MLEPGTRERFDQLQSNSISHKSDFFEQSQELLTLDHQTDQLGWASFPSSMRLNSTGSLPWSFGLSYNNIGSRWTFGHYSVLASFEALIHLGLIPHERILYETVIRRRSAHCPRKASPLSVVCSSQFNCLDGQWEWAQLEVISSSFKFCSPRSTHANKGTPRGWFKTTMLFSSNSLKKTAPHSTTPNEWASSL